MEDKKTINIHGKEYLPVVERLKEFHTAIGDNHYSIESTVLLHDPVVVQVKVITDMGTYMGTSAANPAKSIEKASPYEVAETSALGRALGMMGYGLLDSIASADEMVKATTPEQVFSAKKVTTTVIPVGTNTFKCRCGKAMAYGETKTGKKKYECPARDYKEIATMTAHDIQWIND
jgi:hypothetical protein